MRSAKFPVNFDMARRTQHTGASARAEGLACGRCVVGMYFAPSLAVASASASYVALFLFLSRSLLVAVLFDVLLTASGNLLVTMARATIRVVESE